LLKLKVLLWLSLVTGYVHAAPVLTLGTSVNYCMATCYIRIPFTIINYEPKRNIGMIYCDVEVELTSIMAAYDGQIRTKNLKQSPIGVFKITAGAIKGDVEVDTGISKKNFREAKVKSASCHL
jgi:hypothetical protein